MELLKKGCLNDRVVVALNANNDKYLSKKKGKKKVKKVGALDSGSFVWEDTGSNPGVPNSSVWDGGQWRDSVSLARVDPALNGYLEKSGEGKQEGCAKAQDGWPPTPHCAPGWRAKKRRSTPPVRTVKS